MKEKWQRLLPFVFLAICAVSRWPGLFPPGFSVAYALMFCAGAFFPGRRAWWIPLGTIVFTDVVLNFYYQSHGVNGVWHWEVIRYQLVNYLAYAVVFGLGRRFNRRSSLTALLGGGVLGALLFYLITNTASWLFNPFGNPEYSKTFFGWITALITGTRGWPQTWEFFRNTLLSGGLFTALFAAAMKLPAPAESPQEKVAGVRPAESDDESEPEPEEAKA